MSRIPYSKENHAMHAASMANHGIALSSSEATWTHEGIVVTSVEFAVIAVKFCVGSVMHTFWSRNIGRVSIQKVMIETTMTDMEMTATMRAAIEVSGYSNSCQITR